MSEYRPRIADQLLTESLEALGAVLVQGTKWCGKTTTSVHHANSVLYMDDPTQKAQNLALVSTAIGVAGITAWNAVAGIGAGITTAFGAAVAFLTSPITLVIAAIGALIAIGYLLYKNWDEISAYLKQIWESIKTVAINVWNGIKDF